MLASDKRADENHEVSSTPERAGVTGRLQGPQTLEGSGVPSAADVQERSGFPEASLKSPTYYYRKAA